MSHEADLSVVVSGSFSKFKPEIDLAIDEFKDLGVTVLAPGKGWLYKPPRITVAKADLQFFRPLPSEIGLTIREIEDSFLESIKKSDFVWIVNPEGFIGETVALEIGFAKASNVPIYSQRQILDQELMALGYIYDIKVATPQEAAIDTRKRKLIKE